MPMADSGRLGVAIGTVEGKTWSQVSGNATSSTAQLIGYGQWQSGMLFAEAQLGLMYQQETVHRNLPLFGTATRGSTDGLAGGGGVRAGLQQTIGGWLIEPSLGFGGFALHLNSLTEGGGALAESIGGATLGSSASTLAVSAQRAFPLSETVVMTATARLGWSHEFADNDGEGLGELRGPDRQRVRADQRADRARRRTGRARHRHQGGSMAGNDVRPLRRRLQRQQHCAVAWRRCAAHLVGAGGRSAGADDRLSSGG